jgi:preprotein translocase subunit SecA
MLFHVEVTAQDAELERHESDGLIYDGGSSESYAGSSSTSTLTPAAGGGGSSSTTGQTSSNGAQAIGRNDPCPCGSGKKYKRCHGLAA